MKRIQIGDTSIPDSIPYWSGGKNSDALRMSEKELYAKIDFYQELSNITLDMNERDQYYTEMDKLYVILCLIDEFGDDIKQLERAGIAMNQMLIDNRFKTSYSSLDWRNEAVNNIVRDAVRLTSDIWLDESMSSDFIKWWHSTILDQNYYLNIDGEVSYIRPETASIGASEYDEYSAKFKDGGAFYMYVVCDSRLLDTATSMYKKQQQNETLAALQTAGMPLKRAAMLDLSKSSIINKTGKTPDSAIQEFKQGIDPFQKNSIGELILAIIGLVTAIVSLVSYIIDNKRAKTDKETAEILSKSNLNNIAPDTYDFDGDGVADVVFNPETGKYESVKKTSFPTWALVVAGLAALYFIM
jgi:hypothetical protein